MKQPKMMSLDEPRSTRSTPSSARNNAYRSRSAHNAAMSYSGQGRISPLLPIGLAAVTLLVVARAIAESDNRSTTQRLLDRASRNANRWWSDTRDSADYYGSRAWDWLPDAGRTRDWLYDALPSRRSLSNLFSSSSNDWLPDMRSSKRHLLAGFDWRNPPRWLGNVDLSTSSKRRKFMRDLRRYGNRRSNDFLSSIGWR